MGAHPLTTTPVVGTPATDLAPTIRPGSEPVADGAIRVTILGSGDPFTNKAQGSASVLMEVGNPQRDFFFSTWAPGRSRTSTDSTFRSPRRPRSS